MRYKRLGPSDLNVSVISMGCWAIGGRGWGRVDERESLTAVEVALDAGINFFDTADIYGFGRSEAVLGKALRKHPEALVATKVGLRQDDQGRVRHDLSPAYIRSACDASLGRLQREQIDLYLIHWPDTAVELNDALAALQGLIEAGKVRYIGASNLGPADLETAASVSGFVAYQDRFNLLQRGALKSTIPVCRRHNIGFIAYEPLFKGMLTGKYAEKPTFGRKDHRRTLDRFGSRFNHYRTAIDKFVDVARGLEIEPEALALALLLEDAATTAVGAKTATQIQADVRGAAVGPAVLDAARSLLG